MITVEEHTGENIRSGDLVITPISKVLKIKPTGFSGGLIWNRPIAIRVQRGAEERVLAIPDITRQVILTLALFSIVFAVIATSFGKRNVKNEK